MDLREDIDLDTGAHRFIITLAAKEILLISDVGKTLPREITDSQKLSDKFVVLSMVAKGIEELQARRDAAKEWPTDAPDA